MTDWPVEPLPDGDLVYYRVQKNWVRDGSVLPGVFRDRAGAMSTDWMKYSTPVETRNRAKVPTDNAVVSFAVGDLRQKARMIVRHSPDPQANRRGR